MFRLRSTDQPSRGGAILGILFVPVVLAAAIYLIFFLLFGYSVPPGYFGLRQTKFGPFAGFRARSLEPGIHWGVPGGFYSVVHVFPASVQILNFNRDQAGNDLSALEVQTADRATVDVDVTVITRLFPAPSEGAELVHGGPADLVQRVGINASDWRNQIRRISEDEIKRALADVSTGQFYDPHIRERRMQVAQSRISEALAPYGICVEAVLLRRYTYRDERIDEAIFKKNLQDQEERLNVQASNFAEQQARLEQVAAEKDAEIETLRVSGDGKARVTESEGHLYETKRQAEGNLEIAKAKAEVDKVRAGALSSSAGASNYVARELSSVLTSLKGGVVSGLDPYDLDAWMKRLGVEKEAGGE